MMAIGDKMVVVFLFVMFFQSSSSIQEVSVKLIGGSTPREGNVYALNSENKMGPVCDDYWTDRNLNAIVVCRQLGFDSGVATSRSKFGNVSGAFSMDNVNCTGREARIQDCSYSRQHNCAATEGAGVNCTIDSVKLIGGSIPSEGNVYAINSENKLGPVCDDSWSNRDARVVCRQLGYAGGVATTQSKFGNVEDDFSMDNVNCNGSEARIQDCSYSIRDDCGSSEGAGVNCTNLNFPAAIDGQWSNWSSFNPCSVTCGDAIKTRRRTCSNPPPSNGGEPCPGLDMEGISCGLSPCGAIDGQWSNWSSFNPCQATCGNATKTRRRTCSNPPPRNGGQPCPGLGTEVANCGLSPCGNEVEDVIQAGYVIEDVIHSSEDNDARVAQVLGQIMKGAHEKEGALMAHLRSGNISVQAYGSCSILDAVSCAKMIGGTVATCVATARNTVSIISCIKNIIGAGNTCMPCVCTLLEMADISCPVRGPGTLKSWCYDDVKVYNDLEVDISGEIHMGAGCESEAYTNLSAGRKFDHDRGCWCLLTGLTAHYVDKTTGRQYNCESYSSSGTSYSNYHVEHKPGEAHSACIVRRH